MDYKIISNYQKDKALRDSFNELSKKVFGLDFENWYQSGFWTDKYIPYSILINNRIVSNVSVNLCNFDFNGKEVRLIQLGTIMTDPEFRRKGLARTLLSKILEEYEGKVDGIYLFGNDSVLDFYPKFGFVSQKEYQYSKNVEIKNEKFIQEFPLKDEKFLGKMVDIVKNKTQPSSFYMTKNTDLYMFYLSQFMKDYIYYLKEEDTYVIAEVIDKTLCIHAVFGETSLDRVIQSFGSEIKKVVLCFTPTDSSGYKIEELKEEDTTLFVRGKFFQNIKNACFMFPTLSHA